MELKNRVFVELDELEIERKIARYRIYLSNLTDEEIAYEYEDRVGNYYLLSPEIKKNNGEIIDLLVDTYDCKLYWDNPYLNWTPTKGE